MKKRLSPIHRIAYLLLNIIAFLSICNFIPHEDRIKTLGEIIFSILILIIVIIIYYSWWSLFKLYTKTLETNEELNQIVLKINKK